MVGWRCRFLDDGVDYVRIADAEGHVRLRTRARRRRCLAAIYRPTDDGWEVLPRHITPIEDYDVLVVPGAHRPAGVLVGRLAQARRGRLLLRWSSEAWPPPVEVRPDRFLDFRLVDVPPREFSLWFEHGEFIHRVGAYTQVAGGETRVT